MEGGKDERSGSSKDGADASQQHREAIQIGLEPYLASQGPEPRDSGCRPTLVARGHEHGREQYEHKEPSHGFFLKSVLA